MDVNLYPLKRDYLSGAITANTGDQMDHLSFRGLRSALLVPRISDENSKVCAWRLSCSSSGERYLLVLSQKPADFTGLILDMNLTLTVYPPTYNYSLASGLKMTQTSPWWVAKAGRRGRSWWEVVLGVGRVIKTCCQKRKNKLVMLYQRLYLLTLVCALANMN